MKKSKAIIILLCALLVLLGVGYVDLYGVDAEGTASASDISLGLDLAGGVSITYQVVGDEEPDATDMADTIAKLQKRVENYSKEAIVSISRFPVSPMRTRSWKSWDVPVPCISLQRQTRTAMRITLCRQ